MRTNKLAQAGILAALALILGWIDSLIPLSSALPGLKLGLANLAVVIALYRLDIRLAAAVSAVKVLLSALLFGSVSGLIYSASGAVASLIVMMLVKRAPSVGAVGTSAAGGAAHIAAQFAAAAVLTSTPALLRLMPPMLMVGTLTGSLLGFAAIAVTKRIPENLPGQITGRKGVRTDEK